MQRSFFIHIVSLHFWTHVFVFLQKICAMNHFPLPRDDHAFFSCNRWRLCYSFYVRTMCFVLHSFNNVEFICNLYSRSTSFSVAIKHLNFSLQHFSMATSCCWLHRMHASIRRWLHAFILFRIKNSPLKPFSLTLYERKHLQHSQILYLSLSMRIVYKYGEKIMLEKKYETFSFKHSIWIPTAKEVKKLHLKDFYVLRNKSIVRSLQIILCTMLNACMTRTHVYLSMHFIEKWSSLHST